MNRMLLAAVIGIGAWMAVDAIKSSNYLPASMSMAFAYAGAAGTTVGLGICVFRGLKRAMRD